MNPSTLSVLAGPMLLKGVRWLVGFLGVWLLSHAFTNSATFITGHADQITGGIVSLALFLITDGYSRIVSTLGKAKVNTAAGLPADTSHDETADKVKDLVQIAAPALSTAASNPSAAALRGTGIPTALLLALFLPAFMFTGCNTTSDLSTLNSTLAKASTTAQSVLSVSTLVPSKYKAELNTLILNYVTAHPTFSPKLETVANALESVASANAKLPDPNNTMNTLLATWGGGIPEIGPFIVDFEAFYKVAYPYLTGGAAALTELAELIRSYETAIVSPGGTVITGTQANAAASFLTFAFIAYDGVEVAYHTAYQAKR